MSELYEPKFELGTGDRIATAGSCFAQKLSSYLKRSDLDFVDVEPAMRGMPLAIANRFGYGLYSARYGNIYTARQLRQLLEDCVSERIDDDAIWQKDGRYYDALRPAVEPNGLHTADDVKLHRLDHLRRIYRMFDKLDVFIFTLGLTEAWADIKTERVFPTVPGSLAGTYDAGTHAFQNFTAAQVHEDLDVALSLMRELAPGLNVLLTVSPVPLTATASGKHVLSATTYSKSVLRVVAEETARAHAWVDYFPSYEIITGSPYKAAFYNSNLRTVTDAGVAAVMKTFFGQHPKVSLDVSDANFQIDPASGQDAEDPFCEEALLEAFADQ